MPIEVVQQVKVNVDGVTYRGELGDKKVITQLEAKLTAYEKSKTDLDEFLAEHGIQREAASTPASPAPKRNRSAGKPGPDASAVRAWAKGKGMEVNDRGAIPKHIVDSYLKENG
ncbi:histone-like nucleoid-structuring protein Lsr2 [Kitasatospora sp. NPDC127116]|uniref:Lsr2 family DNA-binding protein n=1 Tax=Kitasatospora sp. NPDC127116 TaxID=3345367 RepID=UPI00362C1037